MPSVNRIIFFLISRLNYHIKQALNAMVNEDLINMDDDMNNFCVSWFTSRTADIGIRQVISSCNNHSIPGKCLLLYTHVLYL